MHDKSIYVIAKIFDQQGCAAYRCKTLNEARCLPGTLQALSEEGVQIVILDDPEIYSEYAPYQYIDNMKEFIDRVYMLNRFSENIIYQFSQQLKDIIGSKLTKVIVYGSCTRGNYNVNSDVDVMILVKMSDNEIKEIANQVYDLAFDMEIDTGVNILPIIKNEEHYEYWLDTLPFYKNIHEEGVIVYDRKRKMCRMFF